jgi:hypothetical protein
MNKQKNNDNYSNKTIIIIIYIYMATGKKIRLFRNGINIKVGRQ